MKLSKESNFFTNIKWLKNIFVKIDMLSQYIAKCKYTQKMIKIIAKLNEIFIHILNMSWLYHFNYNWKVWLMWFHKKTSREIFHSNEQSVLKKNILLKNYFHLNDNKNYVGGLCIEFHYTKIYPKIVHLFLPKTPPPWSVFSPCISWFSERFFCYYISWSKYVWYFYYHIFWFEDIAWNFFCYNSLSNEPTNCWFGFWCYLRF